MDIYGGLCLEIPKRSSIYSYVLQFDKFSIFLRCEVRNNIGTFIVSVHSERVTLMEVLIDLYHITSQVGICSFDRHLCQ